MKLPGKTVVITGAGRGIGRALAERLGRDGGHIALLDVNPEDLRATRQALEGEGVRARDYTVDVATEAAVIKAKDGVIAGKMSLAQWQAVLNVNLTGVFLCGREAAQRMIELGNGGVIINISSVSRHGNVGQSNYSAAKAGVAALAVVWAKELARHGIRAAAIAPGGVRTEILSTMRPEMLEKLIAPVPLKRLAEPAEIADAAAFVIENEFFTGRCLDIDGGSGI